MSEFSSALSIAASGMRSQTVRLSHVSENIANADTPGFKARDLDFQAALKQAVSGSRAPVLDTRGAGQRAGTAPRANLESMQVLRTAVQPSADGNTVSTQREHAAFAQASIEYEASLRFLDGQIKSLMTAITGE